jgi:hypothetical protein
MTGRGKVQVDFRARSRGPHIGCIGQLREMPEQPDECIVRTVQCDECGEVVGWTPTTQAEAWRKRRRAPAPPGTPESDGMPF